MKLPCTRTLASVVAGFLCLGAAATPAAAEQRYIVRAENGYGSILTGPLGGRQIVTAACALVGCTVRHGIDGDLDRLFLVTTPDTVDPYSFVALLPTLPGIEHAELDRLVSAHSHTAGDVPPSLLNTEKVTFFGTTVPAGYVQQPASSILGIAAMREQYGLTGFGVTVAVIDTGIDPTHPALQYVVRQGYDFTRDIVGGSERTDLDQSIGVPTETSVGYVNQSTIAILDQSTIAILDDARYSAFGHGTMVAGIIHLVAPYAGILPLKAFRSDGTGYSSDVLRAIYFAVRARAQVINMSFSFNTPSLELTRAINYATSYGAVPVSSVGNDGQRVIVYPAAMSNVIGVASTTDFDVLSAFSNFGTEVAWIAAPGEGVISTYPLGTYAAVWGTSFSTPFAAGTAALLEQVDSRLNAAYAADAEGYAVWVSPEVSRGRLDIPAAVQAWRTRLGLR